MKQTNALFKNKNLQSSPGQKIKLLRKLKGLTQKQLGQLIGFPEQTADVRIAQYESGKREPKKDIQNKLAAVLACNPLFLSAPTISNPQDLIQFLFEIDRITPAQIDKNSKTISFNLAELLPYSLLNEWYFARKLLSQSDYLLWKASYDNSNEKSTKESDYY